MSKEIFEEKGGPHLGHAAGRTDAEKQASQLASDVKYKVKKKLGKGTKLNPAQIAQEYLKQLAASPAPSVVKALAKKKIIGESYVDVNEFVNESINKALNKVFVEKFETEENNENEYLQELYSKVNSKGERLYHIRVTDKKTGNTYTRDATRAKIAELRSNPNISSVEMSDLNKDTKGEKSKGEHTANVKSGKGLDPVGKEDGDVDNDGDKDKSDKYLMKRRKAIGNAIATRKESLDPVGQEDGDIDNDGDKDKTDKYLSKRRKAIGKAIETRKEDYVWFEEKTKKDDSEKPIDVMKGKNTCVKVGPSLGESINIKAIYEKMNLAKADMGDVVKDFQKSDAPQFRGKSKKKRQQMAIAAKLEAERQVKEAADCGCDDNDPKSKKDENVVGDVRELPTKMNLVKNKMRAMGLKMDYEPEGDMVDEARAVGSVRMGDQNPKGAAARVSSGRGMTMTPARGLGASKPKGDDKTRAKRQAAQAKEDRRAAARDRAAEGEDRLSRLVRSVQNSSYEPEGEVLDERRKEDKVAGTPRKPRDRAFEIVAKSMGSGRMGVQPRGVKKQKGAPTPGPVNPPAQKVAMRRAAAQRAQDMYKPRAGESD